MIKNLLPYRNKWIPKYYWASNNIIFNISSSDDTDNCGLQVVDPTLSGDDLGQDACTKACGIVMNFVDSEGSKTYYFPLQNLIADGDRVTSSYFALRHPFEFTTNGFYMGKFLKPIDDEMISMIVSGKTFDEVFNSLPAWLTTPDGTDDISIPHFIKGTLKKYPAEQYPDGFPAGVEVGAFDSVYFCYRNAAGALQRIPINKYTEEFVKEVFRQQIALMGVDYINKKLDKQMNSKLTDASEEAIQNIEVAGNSDTAGRTLGNFEKVVIVHNGEIPTTMSINAYQEMTAAAANEQGEPVVVPAP